jgi:hypothetical protein
VTIAIGISVVTIVSGPALGPSLPPWSFLNDDEAPQEAVAHSLPASGAILIVRDYGPLLSLFVRLHGVAVRHRNGLILALICEQTRG